jgi:hypothetical protein
MGKNFLVIIILAFFFTLNFSSFFFVFAQTPTPTYAPFEDTNKEGTNYYEWLDRYINNSGMKCGEVGQICCGKEISPEIENFSDFISGSIFRLLPGSFFLEGALSFLPSLFARIFNPIISRVSHLPSNFFHLEKRGYCVSGYPSNELDPERCTCVSSSNLSAAKLCGVLSSNSEQNQCFNKCMKDGQGVWTALGCVSSDLSTVIKEKVFGWGVGLAGIISLFCIIYAAFQIQTSSGNAEKVKKAQELLTSCIMGLMLIIFSVFILKLIGIDILKIPGFSGK